ncbi:hypothetical protein [Ensifer sp. MJa1]|uniref:hypothetical protein n=1 Tax=Ensifer sp. MJa1 TaxID=2919888 RepID=UPI0030098292
MTNRFRPHFRALRVAAALLAASPVISLLTAPAQALVVFDPKNYAQNLLSAARALVDRLPVPENNTTGERWIDDEKSWVGRFSAPKNLPQYDWASVFSFISNDLQLHPALSTIMSLRR